MAKLSFVLEPNESSGIVALCGRLLIDEKFTAQVLSTENGVSGIALRVYIYSERVKKVIDDIIKESDEEMSSGLLMDKIFDVFGLDPETVS